MSQDTLFEKIAAEIVDRIYVMFIDDQQLPEGETTEEQKIAVALKIMRPLRALPSGYVQVPEGWKPVPIEPTEEMLKAFRNASENSDHPSYRPPYPAHRAGYDALLAATPTPSDSKPGEGE